MEESGTGASTTGNIYGIYDMSGGAREYVMGVMKARGSQEPAVGSDESYNSGWSGKLYYGTDYIGTYGLLKEIGSKYYDLYDYGTSDSDYTRYHKGDATYEIAGWYSSRAAFVRENSPFFTRGGHMQRTVVVGNVLDFDFLDGYAIKYNGGRPTLVQTN